MKNTQIVVHFQASNFTEEISFTCIRDMKVTPSRPKQGRQTAVNSMSSPDAY